MAHTSCPSKVSARVDGGLPTSAAWVAHHKTTVYWDSCAEHTLAGIHLRSQGKPVKDRTAYPTEVLSYNEQSSPVIDVREITITFRGGHKLTTPVLITDRDDDSIFIGGDIMWRHGLMINFEKLQVTWTDFRGFHQVRMHGDRLTEDIGTASLACTVKIPASRHQFVSLDVDAEEGSQIIFQADSQILQQQECTLPTSIHTVKDKRIMVPITNLSGRKQRIQSNVCLGTWIPADPSVHITNWTLTEGRITEILDRLDQVRPHDAPVHREQDIRWGDALNEEERQWYTSIIRKFPRVFSPAKGALNASHSTECDIQLKPEFEHKPQHVRGRRLSPAEREIIKKEITKMLELDVIEKGSSPWSFPVILVTKPDGTWRFCIDYRRLNAITIKNRYPLPRIDEALDRLQGATIYSLIDLEKGFWQVPLSLRGKLLTAFVTPFGQYLWKRMPFGLTNAPAIFQQMMDEVIHEISWAFCMVYIDDIIIFSKSKEAHAIHLAEVLGRLERAGLTVRTDKCTIATSQINYLGFKVSRSGVSPQERLKKAILEMPRPTNKEGTRRFVAMANFYRRFIPQFSITAKPLTNLQKQDTEFKWEAEESEAFEKLKAALASNPIMKHPEFDKEFIIATDAASKVGIGAVLLQEEGGILKPIAYISRSFTKHEKNYSVTEQECLGCIFAMQQFRPYVYGRRFRLQTDHQALKWLLTQKEPKGRIARWLWEVLEFDFEVEYIPGKTHILPDTLSRAPLQHEEQENHEESAEQKLLRLASRMNHTQASTKVTETQLTDAMIIAAQKADEETQELVKQGKYKGRNIVQGPGGIWVVQEEEREKILLPKSLWPIVLKAMHDAGWAGHFGITKTWYKVSVRFVGRGLKQYTYAWVRTCRDCGSRKVKPTKIRLPLSPQGLGEYGDRVGIDLIGPMPASPDGNTYAVIAVEYSTRFAWAVPIKSRHASQVAKALINHVFCNTGPIRVLSSDQAEELVGSVIKCIAEIYQMKQTHSVPHRPQYVGLVERTIRSLKDEMTMFVNQLQKDWDQCIGLITYAYNTSQQATLRKSPWECAFGREPRQPCDLQIPAKVTTHARSRDIVANLKKAVAQVNGEALTNYRRATARIEKEYNKRMGRFLWTFEEGDHCWVYNFGNTRCKGKLRHHWRGPYRLLQYIEFGNWELKDVYEGKKIITHVSFMQPFFAEDKVLDEVAHLCAEFVGEYIQAANLPTQDETFVIDGIEYEVEQRRKTERNDSGRYELEVQLTGLKDRTGRARWLSLSELEKLAES